MLRLISILKIGTLVLISGLRGEKGDPGLKGEPGTGFDKLLLPPSGERGEDGEKGFSFS